MKDLFKVGIALVCFAWSVSAASAQHHVHYRQTIHYRGPAGMVPSSGVPGYYSTLPQNYYMVPSGSCIGSQAGVPGYYLVVPGNNNVNPQSGFINAGNVIDLATILVELLK